MNRKKLSTRMGDPETPPRVTRAMVRDGWNQLSMLYRPPGATRFPTGHTDRLYGVWLAPIMKELPKGAPVLDLGCGCGVPATRILARRFQVTGVDLSDVQIARARELVPSARFRRSDMSRVRFPPGSFQAVVSFYAIFHLPLKEQYPLLKRIYRWLTPGGYFVAILGAGRYKGVDKGWLGSDTWMYWDHVDADTYQRWLEKIGFVVELSAFVPEKGSGGHQLFRLRRPSDSSPSPRRHREQ